MNAATVESYERDGYRVDVFYDPAPENPRQMFPPDDTLLVQFSTRYAQPDGPDSRTDLIIDAWNRGTSWNTRGAVHHDTELVERYARAFLDAEACEWWDDPRSDSRILGIVFRGSDYTEPEKAIKAIVEEYAAYAQGDVYYFTVYNPNGEIVESLGGFYGDDGLESLRDHAASIIYADRARIHREMIG